MAEHPDTALERRSIILGEVYDKRKEQIALGYSLEHDQEEGPTHLIVESHARLYRSLSDDDYTRETLVTTAALLVAAIEVLDTKENN